MRRSSIVISVLSSLCFVVVMTVFLYWLLTVLAPSPAGWSDEVMWQPVGSLVEDQDILEEAGELPGELALDDTVVKDVADLNRGESVNGDMHDHEAIADEVEVEDVLDEVNGDGLIAINTASAEQLQELPGIGPAKAQAIIDYRSMYGKFNHADELLGVKGIGEKTLEKLKPLIKLD